MQVKEEKFRKAYFVLKIFMNDAELCKEVLKYVHGAFAKLETFEDKLHSQDGKPERERVKNPDPHQLFTRSVHAFKLFPLYSFH